MNVQKNNGWLRIRFSHQRKKYCFALGLKDSPANRAKADLIKLQILEDIENSCFDHSLARYKPHPFLKKPLVELTCGELFSDWIKYKSAFCDSRTIEWYAATAKNLEFFGNVAASSITPLQIAGFVNWLRSQPAKSETQRRKLESIKACWDWGIANRYFQLAENPWKEAVKLIKPSQPELPNPFTQKEVEAILEGFQADCPELYLFVRFLFSTGCRTGEARALRWSDLSEDCTRCQIATQLSRKAKRKPTKNRKIRQLWLPDTLVAELRELKNVANGESVFTWEGKEVSGDVFYKRWGRVLSNYSIKYRKPYNTRHTFISHALEQGVSPSAIAQQTGHSLKVLFEHYAGYINSSPRLPDIFSRTTSRTTLNT
jgi:integrase